VKRLALACVAGFALAGCGGGGDDTPSQFGPGQNPADTPTATESVAGESATPTTGATAEATPSANTYTVVAGDTLWGIAQQFGTTVEAIAAANNITNTNSIEIGQVLTIPPAASQ
jgi:LysM repeat protein